MTFKLMSSYSKAAAAAAFEPPPAVLTPRLVAEGVTIARLRPRLLVMCGSGPPPGSVVVGHFTFIHFYFTSWIILLSMGLTDDGVTIHQFTLLILAFYAHDWGALCHGGSESAATLRPVLWCLESRLRACKRAWLAPILRRTTTSFLFWDQCVGASNRPLDR